MFVPDSIPALECKVYSQEPIKIVGLFLYRYIIYNNDPSAGEAIFTGGGDFLRICGKWIAFSQFLRYNKSNDL